MSTAQNDILNLCKTMRMDLTNAQGKLSDIMRQVAALDLPDEPVKADPVRLIDRMITNGAISDPVHLEAELRAAAITGVEAVLLRQRIETTA